MVYGDRFKKAFGAEIGREKSVSALREAIRVAPYAPKCLKGVRPADFDLWKVYIPITNEETAPFPDLKLPEAHRLGVAEIVGEVFPDSEISHERPSHVNLIVTNSKFFTIEGHHDSALASSSDRQSQAGQFQDPLEIICDERLATFQDWMDKSLVCLLRSPSSSGKTTLASLLGKWFRNIRASCRKHLYAREPMYIFVDDAHQLYGLVPFFWSELVLLMHSNYPVRVLLLARYGNSGIGSASGTTPVPIASLGLDGPRLWRKEYDMLVDKFISSSSDVKNGVDLGIPLAVRGAIFNSTLGHPGVVTEILKLLHHAHQSAGHHAQLHWITTRQFSRNEVQFLRDSFYKIDEEYTFPADLSDPIIEPIVRDFERSGIVTQSDTVIGHLQFAAPLVHAILLRRLFGYPSIVPTDLPAPVE
ncbi:hypothetical protein AMATHDRAFT_7629 [Amanita thiersii Skay4041]|uniref:Uncharacterized protein n=1 Tax=Amanita thiersii Skay4041 TaxID=703135 RepID=A0A2A9NEA5_9AGAR|nr:hypothetical protein AMATHDRAFT_7629 [Amanita thiersii Skay4041]